MQNMVQKTDDALKQSQTKKTPVVSIDPRCVHIDTRCELDDSDRITRITLMCSCVFSGKREGENGAATIEGKAHRKGEAERVAA